MNRHYRALRRGFTLIELLGVISIIGVLAAILLPSLARARETARRASCQSGLMQFGIAFRLYADEHDGAFPWSGGNNNEDCLKQPLHPYLINHWIFLCPSDSDETQEDLQDESGNVDYSKNFRCSYDYLGAYTTTPITLPPPSRPAPLWPIMWDLWSGSFWDPENPQEKRITRDTALMNHVPGGGNVLYLDGSVSFSRSDQWAHYNLPEIPIGIDYADMNAPVEAASSRFLRSPT